MNFFIKFTNRSTTTSSLSTGYLHLLLLLLLAPVITSNRGLVASPAKLYDIYETVRTESWRLIEQTLSQTGSSLGSSNSTDSVTAGIVKELLIYHDSFIKTDVTAYERINKDPQSFSEFKHFYELGHVKGHVQGHLIVINSWFEAFRIYLDNALQTNEINVLSLLIYTESVLYKNMWSIERSFNGIHNITVKEELFTKMALDSSETVCSTQRSRQQVIHQIFEAVALAELKGYVMMQFSWMILHTSGMGYFIERVDLMRHHFESRTNRTRAILKGVMDRADNSLWRCDAPENEGRTYERLTKLLQGYIENEVDLNYGDTCLNECRDYKDTQSYTCSKKSYCSKQPRCTGRVLNCKFIDSDMWICPATPSSKRRYEYIEYENGRVLGHKKNCTRGTTKEDSWWGGPSASCDYCFCVCDEQSDDSDRYFSVREVVSNTTENKIVTGLRFRKKNRIMFLQIQEGKLLPNGQVNPNTVMWQKINEFNITDPNVRNGVDYHRMEWNKRAMDMNKVKGGVGEVVTGVRFKLVGSHLNLEVQITEFNFETGKLIEPQTFSVWKSNYGTQPQNKLTEIKIDNPDVPTGKKVGKSVINKRDDVYIEFTHSGIDADVAQTTIPYLDAQDVVHVPPMPLTGVGLYHKAAPGSGGFVGPRIYTYDMSAHI